MPSVFVIFWELSKQGTHDLQIRGVNKWSTSCAACLRRNPRFSPFCRHSNSRDCVRMRACGRLMDTHWIHQVNDTAPILFVFVWTLSLGRDLTKDDEVWGQDWSRLVSGVAWPQTTAVETGGWPDCSWAVVTLSVACMHSIREWVGGFRQIFFFVLLRLIPLCLLTTQS